MNKLFKTRLKDISKGISTFLTVNNIYSKKCIEEPIFKNVNGIPIHEFILDTPKVGLDENSIVYQQLIYPLLAIVIGTITMTAGPRIQEKSSDLVNLMFGKSKAEELHEKILAGLQNNPDEFATQVLQNYNAKAIGNTYIDVVGNLFASTKLVYEEKVAEAGKVPDEKQRARELHQKILAGLQNSPTEIATQVYNDYRTKVPADTDIIVVRNLVNSINKVNPLKSEKQKAQELYNLLDEMEIQEYDQYEMDYKRAESREEVIKDLVDMIKRSEVSLLYDDIQNDLQQKNDQKTLNAFVKQCPEAPDGPLKVVHCLYNAMNPSEDVESAMEI